MRGKPRQFFHFSTDYPGVDGPGKAGIKTKTLVSGDNRVNK